MQRLTHLLVLDVVVCCCCGAPLRDCGMSGVSSFDRIWVVKAREPALPLPAGDKDRPYGLVLFPAGRGSSPTTSRPLRRGCGGCCLGGPSSPTVPTRSSYEAIRATMQKDTSTPTNDGELRVCSPAPPIGTLDAIAGVGKGDLQCVNLAVSTMHSQQGRECLQTDNRVTKR